jgi:hypothetical protein
MWHRLTIVLKKNFHMTRALNHVAQIDNSVEKELPLWSYYFTHSPPRNSENGIDVLVCRHGWPRWRPVWWIVCAMVHAIMYVLRLRGRELSHGLCPFRHGVLGQLAGQHEADGRLDFTTAQRGLFVVRGQFAGFAGDAFKNVVDETIHDAHPLFGNARIGMDLLEHLVNVRRVAFRALLVLGLGAGDLGGLGRGRFAAGCTGFGRSFGHGWMITACC